MKRKEHVLFSSFKYKHMERSIFVYLEHQCMLNVHKLCIKLRITRDAALCAAIKYKGDKHFTLQNYNFWSGKYDPYRSPQNEC
jgi:hypothetical protein